ncbi:glutamate receptor-interacting protein 2-like isoform X2 [Babylonia areolata]|uniref:glutamate receptor-interacting protein 2-like isoform X2 n=1 Tax=Babylonia areolata TaxID=304850 RepID=UPI003FD06D8E
MMGMKRKEAGGLCGCFSLSNSNSSRKKPTYVRPPSEVSISVPNIEDEKRGVAVVELHKKEGCGLGLTVSGGSDKGCRAHISNLRAGSIAQRSDALVVGDVILSVNGIRTSGLKHDEIINLLKNAGEKITLEVEYEMPEPAPSTANIQSRQWEVTLDKEGPGYGFTLRGGMKVDDMRPFPFTVVAIRPGSSAHRHEHVKVGDRVTQVNGYKVTHLSLTEMWGLLQQCGHQTTFTVAYDVAVMDAVEQASGPLLVEIDKTPGAALGIVLTHSSYQGKACVCVESIRPMSVADRSGALHVGDHILSIDGASVEHMSVAEATQLLKSGAENCVKLEILPVTHLQHCASREALARKSLAPSLSSVALPGNSPGLGGGVSHSATLPLPTLPPTFPSSSHAASSTSAIGHFATISRGSRASGLSKYTWPAVHRKVNSCMSMVSTATSIRTANNQVCHSETVEVMLFADVKGLGITLEGGVFSTAVLSQPPAIADIHPRSAADKCGVLQEGDRVLQVNGMDSMDRTLEEVNQFLRESRPRCVLEVEFDVAESVTPTSGTYTVKLVKKAGGTGITVGGRRRTTDPLVVTDVRRGSPAHRCGSIQPGDKLLAINDVCLDSCTVEDAMHLLELPDELVKIKVQRDDPEEGTKDCVTYTVQLHRHGGPLGITISGTEDPLDDIVISELTAGGLAQRTGAMHVGDRLLGINDSPTRNKPLSEAIRMLQSAGDVVTLRIARPAPTQGLKAKGAELEESTTPTTPIPSIDSAMASWDSLGQDVGEYSGGAGGWEGMVVAVPQSQRGSMASSQQPPSHTSTTTMDPPTHDRLSSDGWPDHHQEEEEEDDDDDDDQSQHSEASSVEVEDWVRTLGDLEASSGSEMLRQISASLRQRSTFSLDRRSNASDSRQTVRRRAERRSHSTSRVQRSSKSQDGLHRLDGKPGSQEGPATTENRTFDQHLQTIFTPTPIQLHRLSLEKTSATADFGFSLSDGLYEKGVYVSAVRTASPAQKAGVRTFDRILQVNGHKTRDFDCVMTVPLIAEAGNKLNLVVCRNPLLRHSHLFRDSLVIDADPHTKGDKPQLAEGADVVRGREGGRSGREATVRPKSSGGELQLNDSKVGGGGGGEGGGRREWGGRGLRKSNTMSGDGRDLREGKPLLFPKPPAITRAHSHIAATRPGPLAAKPPVAAKSSAAVAMARMNMSSAGAPMARPDSP